ncbi:mechanosensitive ion channel domain-containing protein [Abyssibacter sp.]|jgi:small conductance mechanosensitive channel|uniref:mechanosensitive ion channel family protein n=1 Tax=Abyssibacter sp. TaxID=2320200 RepID=UPI0025C282FA|nr:mechanosensitive ion channel domain-containing protein [Abyssibacter sp.]MCK5858970.1 mechanosensitive ion channel [Abyssibacter sp.]
MEFTKEMLNDPQALLLLGIPIAKGLVSAIAIFFIGRWVAQLIIKLAKKAMHRAKLDETLITFLSNVAYGLLLAIIIISALGQLGVDTTSAAALLGGAALAIGLALQNQLSSFAAGAMLILFRPFAKGNVVDIGGQLGIVEEIKITSTILKTFDNQLVWLPNASVWGNKITNYSALPTRRVDLAIGIGYGSDLKKAKDLLVDMLKEEPRILDDPAPSVVVSNLGDSSVDFAVRGWAASADWWGTRCDLIERIKLTFDENDIEIPFPQRTVYLRGEASATEEK